jgi:tRNA(fMet)-specific endonuclease VapC
LIFLDTNICICAMRGEPAALVRRFLAWSSEIHVSAVVVAELEYGVVNSSRHIENAARLAKFLDKVNVVDWDHASARAYAQIRFALKAQPISTEDMMIAACAIAHSATLITNNLREFARVPNLRLENWAAETTQSR